MKGNKTLGNKIQQISLSNKLDFKINEIDDNIKTSYKSIDSKYNSLKSQITDFIKQYEERDDFNLESDFGLMKSKITQNLNIQRQSLMDFVDKLSIELEERLSKAENSIEEHNFIIQDECEKLKNFINIELPKIHSDICNKGETRNDFFISIDQEIVSEFENLQRQVTEMVNKKDECENTYESTLKDIFTRLKAQLQTEQNQRISFEENIFEILEDTCNKLLSDQ